MERAQFEELALSHLDSVFRFCTYLTRNPTDASDLLQEVYARAFRRDVMAAFRPVGGGMKPWLFRIARTTHVMNLERRNTERHVLSELYKEAGGEAPAADAVARLSWKEIGDRLHTAIEALSEEHRDVLMLWGVEGLKYREIAEVLELPMGTVMSRLHRARMQIAARLVGEGAWQDELAGGGVQPFAKQSPPDQRSGR